MGKGCSWLQTALSTGEAMKQSQKLKTDRSSRDPWSMEEKRLMPNGRRALECITTYDQDYARDVEPV